MKKKVTIITLSAIAVATTVLLVNTNESEANDYVLETDTSMFSELGNLFDSSLKKAEDMNEESDQFEIFKSSIDEAEELNDYADDSIDVYSSPEVDEELEKWLFRINFESQYAGVNISDSELMEDAMRAMQKRQVTLLFANDVYGVDFEEEKVKSMIEEEMSIIKEYGHYEDIILTVADNLGLTEQEFLYDFDYDNFLNTFAWREILPFLEDKYPIELNEDGFTYNERLIEAYNNEIISYAEELDIDLR